MFYGLGGRFGCPSSVCFTDLVYVLVGLVLYVYGLGGRFGCSSSVCFTDLVYVLVGLVLYVLRTWCTFWFPVALTKTPLVLLR